MILSNAQASLSLKLKRLEGDKALSEKEIKSCAEEITDADVDAYFIRCLWSAVFSIIC